MKQEYITPTKNRPIFKCYNDYFGYIEEMIYKQWQIKDEKRWIIGHTFALNLTDAINKLHEYIKDNKDHIETNSKFTIVLMDGTINKYGEIKEIKCYSISMKQAKQFKLLD